MTGYKVQRDSWELCSHPFGTFVMPGATKLIIGTFPTHSNNYKDTFKFYYAGKDNKFWSVIKKIFNPKFQYSIGDLAVQERRDFLESQMIGMTDMLQSCYRKNNSSADKDLYPIVLTDIFSILRECGTIEKIILTSRTDVYGALGLFNTYYFIQKGEMLKNVVEIENRIKEADFEFQGRKIKILVPHSTSPTNKHVTEDELLVMYEICLK